MTDFKDQGTVFTLEEDRRCSCVTKHVPLPNRLIRVGTHYLCPTSYYNLLCLLEEYRRFKGEPPGYVCKHYSAFVKSLAGSLFEAK